MLMSMDFTVSSPPSEARAMAGDSTSSRPPNPAVTRLGTPMATWGWLNPIRYRALRGEKIPK